MEVLPYWQIITDSETSNSWEKTQSYEWWLLNKQLQEHPEVNKEQRTFPQLKYRNFSSVCIGTINCI